MSRVLRQASCREQRLLQFAEEFSRVAALAQGLESVEVPDVGGLPEFVGFETVGAGAFELADDGAQDFGADRRQMDEPLGAGIAELGGAFGTGAGRCTCGFHNAVGRPPNVDPQPVVPDR